MNSIKYGFGTVGKQQTDGVIGRFLSWWWQQICAMKPAFLQRDGRQQSSLVFRVQGQSVQVLHVQNDSVETLGQVGLSKQDDDDALLADRIRQVERQHTPHSLLLPADWVAVLPMSLPQAASSNLEQVLVTSHGGLDERIGEGLVRAEAEHTRGVQAFRLLLGE